MYLQGRVPDFILRPVIRALCRQRLREIDHGSFEENFTAKMKWIEGVRARTAIADVPEKANEQHYEVRPFNEGIFMFSTHEPRSPPPSCCRAWVLVPNILVACIPQERRPSGRRRFSCWKATARRLTSRMG